MEDTANGPGGNNKPAGSVYKVAYLPGNGTGSPWSDEIKKDTLINLPGQGELIPPEEQAVFGGWNYNDGIYPAGSKYKVTKNVTFNARWAFDTLDGIKTYLEDEETGNSVLITVTGGAEPNDSDTEALTWKNLLSAIKAAGEAGKTVELDLSGSTLALFGTIFDYTDGTGTAYNTGEKYIKKLILPLAAEAITSIFYQESYGGDNGYKSYFSNLEEVSGINVKSIPVNAFNTLSKLRAFDFPNATYIGGSAFLECKGLESVSLPAAGYIDQNAFKNCTSLTSVSLPVATYIGGSAFDSDSMDSLELPAATSISSSAFTNCKKLESVSLPAVKTITSNAFNGCEKLTSVSLPAVYSLIGNAFDKCNALTTITISAGCSITGNDKTPNGFKSYYESTDGHTTMAAGVYTYGNSKWSYAPLGGTS
ncbi:MAG: leucine-rich repeat domain-containing protein [Spirochaetaceae bacterium]|jgi:hypothetical protein|nr:leucine-rich repeat domain-containing protein [Spirochaetaceae bacterium]